MNTFPAIKAIEAHAEAFDLTEQTIGQMAVQNRRACERIRKGTASMATERRVLEWIEQDRDRRLTAPAQDPAAQKQAGVV